MPGCGRHEALHLLRAHFAVDSIRDHKFIGGNADRGRTYQPGGAPRNLCRRHHHLMRMKKNSMPSEAYVTRHLYLSVVSWH